MHHSHVLSSSAQIKSVLYHTVLYCTSEIVPNTCKQTIHITANFLVHNICTCHAEVMKLTFQSCLYSFSSVPVNNDQYIGRLHVLISTSNQFKGGGGGGEAEKKNSGRFSQFTPSQHTTRPLLMAVGRLPRPRASPCPRLMFARPRFL